MENVSFTYDPIKDIAPVDQFGFVDLRSAFVNASIPGDLSFSEESFNGVEEPRSLVGRSSDVFEAIRKAEYVKSSESRRAAAAADAAGAAAASSAASE